MPASALAGVRLPSPGHRDYHESEPDRVVPDIGRHWQPFVLHLLHHTHRVRLCRGVLLWLLRSYQGSQVHACSCKYPSSAIKPKKHSTRHITDHRQVSRRSQAKKAFLSKALSSYLNCFPTFWIDRNHVFIQCTIWHIIQLKFTTETVQSVYNQYNQSLVCDSYPWGWRPCTGYL